MASVERKQVTAVEVVGDTEYRIVLEQDDHGRYREISRTPLRHGLYARARTGNALPDERRYATP